MDLLENEKRKCLEVITQYNLKYNTSELKKMYELYDYLNLQLKNETNPIVRLKLKEDIELLMNYLMPK